MFTLELILLGKVWALLSPQLRVKYHSCSSTRMVLALNNPQCNYNKETEQYFNWGCQPDKFLKCQSHYFLDKFSVNKFLSKKTIPVALQPHYSLWSGVFVTISCSQKSKHSYYSENCWEHATGHAKPSKGSFNWRLPAPFPRVGTTSSVCNFPRELFWWRQSCHLLFSLQFLA